MNSSWLWPAFFSYQFITTVIKRTSPVFVLSSLSEVRTASVRLVPPRLAVGWHFFQADGRSGVLPSSV